MGFFINPEDLPEALKAQILAAADHHQMHHVSSHHEIMSLFDELSKDGLRTMTSIFSLISKTEPGLAHYFEGLGVAHLYLKHDLCAACGESHTPDFGTIERDSDLDQAVSDAREETAPPTAQAKVELKKTHELLLQEYRLVETLVDGATRLHCTGCGLQYQSLEDRMVKKPDDCHGCHQKSKWG